MQYTSILDISNLGHRAQGAKLHMNNRNFKSAITFSDDLRGFQFLQILHPQGTLFNSPKPHLLEDFGLLICNLAPCKGLNVELL